MSVSDIKNEYGVHVSCIRYHARVHGSPGNKFTKVGAITEVSGFTEQRNSVSQLSRMFTPYLFLL